MGWLAVDGDGTELFFREKPEKYEAARKWVTNESDMEDALELQGGSIERFVGKKMKWEDEPVMVELKDEKLWK